MSGRAARIWTDIDRHSFLEFFPDGKSSSLIVFVHGIFGDPTGTWADTPQTLMMFPALSDLDWGSFGYDSGFIYRRDVTQTLDQLTLWIRTHAKQYKNIFFVAHSMGGLLVRDLSARLAFSGTSEDESLFSSIRHAFLVATPVGGAVWARRIGKIPFVRRLNSHVAYLEQADSYLSRFPGYKSAIAAAKAKGLPRPRYSIFLGTEDQVVRGVLNDVLTKDDQYEGAVPGNHSTLKAALTPNSTLVRRIVQIVSDYSRRSDGAAPSLNLSATPAETFESTAPAEPRPSPKRTARPVILISCSAHKRTDGEVPHPKKGGILSAVADSNVALQAIQTRAQIMGLLQSGRIDGTEFKEGNRAGRPENRALLLGPDFGGAINEPRYLPAYWRYSGRTYQASNQDWIDFANSPEILRPSILIMSGLYGLMPFDEYIQNYDCHITDADSQTSQTVVSYWGPLMTDVLLSHCDRLESDGAEVGPIIDLLSERSYQTAVDWQKIYPVRAALHRVFENRADRDALVNIGIFLRALLRDPAKAGQIVADRFIDEPEFIEPDRIAFEREIGASPLKVARG